MRLSIIGLGLIGGSLGLTLKRAIRPGLEIVGYARRPETASRARELGAVDRAVSSLESALRGADIVILATPVLAIKEIMEQIAPHLAPGSIVTDTASTKAQVMAWAQDYLPSGVAFVGGHPMAGKETWGIEAAEAGLFEGCRYCLIPAPTAGPQAIQQLVNLVEWVGARPLFIDATEHDRAVAAISHLPALLSAALVKVTAESPAWPQMARLAASGYRDLTRLAAGHPDMMRHICSTNKENILNWIDKFTEVLGQFRALVADEGLEAALNQAREARERWLRERTQG